MKFLSDKFLSQYKDKKPPFTELGEFVYYRTYSRWLEEKKRRETWLETCKRAVEYNMSLQLKEKEELAESDLKEMRKEAEKLFDNMFNLRQFLSGRTLWVGGTPVAEKFSLSNFNCSFLILDDFKDFSELFYLLMIGSGVGFRILKDDVAKISKYRSEVELSLDPYIPVPKKDRCDLTSLIINKNVATILVGDSKEGWVSALNYYFEILSSPFYRDVKKIRVNFNSVRPKGERLKTFGGTASGHESLKTMFEKIHKVMNKAEGKLRPIHALDIANIIGENVVVGGVRRTSEICIFDSDDEEVLKAKDNIYYQDDEGNFQVNKNILHRAMSNNSILFKEKPNRERLHNILESIKKTGEPGFVNFEALRKRRADGKGINPCLTGDMRILTSDGYIPIADLDGKEVKLINKDGNESTGRVWCTGEKPVYEIKFINRPSITCTSDHRFMDNEGNEVEAVNLKGKRLMPYLNHNPEEFDVEFVKYGFIQGDGNLGRLKNEEHLGIEVNIGKNDGDIKTLFNVHSSDREIYVTGYKEKLIKLGFSSERLPYRTFPSTYNEWGIKQKRSFLKGCYSANGSVVSCGRITYKTTSKKFANELVHSLKNDFDINAYITINKPKKVKFSNGEYECRESYNVNIQRYNDRVRFYNLIGFVHKYKMDKLKELLIAQSPKVVNVIATGRNEKVYDFNEPITHWGVVEGVITHNCAEILLDDCQTCNLTTTNVYSFVFYEDGEYKLDTVELFKAMRLSARAGIRMTLVDLEIPFWDKQQKKDRLIGVSITGWQDMVDAVNLSKAEEDILLSSIKRAVRDEANKYADELGIKRPLLTTTCKPEGTLSQLPTVSSGIHYSHSPYYIRRVRINAHDPLVKVAEELGWVVKPEVGQDWDTCTTKVIEFPVKAPVSRTKNDVSAIEQLENYKRFMENYVEHNVSITVTVKEHEWEEVEEWLWNNWDDVVAITLLAHDGGVYDLAPYEKITKEEYEERKANMKPFDPELLKKYEIGEDFDIENMDGCEGGLCPIR